MVWNIFSYIRIHQYYGAKRTFTENHGQSIYPETKETKAQRLKQRESQMCGCVTIRCCHGNVYFECNIMCVDEADRETRAGVLVGL